MQTERPQHKKVQTRGRELPPDLAGSAVAVRHKHTAPSPEVPAMRMKTAQIEAAVPPPVSGPSVEEILTAITQHKLVDAARGLSVMIARCASDVPATLARAFVDQAAPALRQTINGLRNGNRKVVKQVLNSCVRRLNGELSDDEKKKLAQFLHTQGCSGTVDAHLTFL